MQQGQPPLCDGCNVDIGNWQGSQYCWATTCPTNKNLKYNACVSTPDVVGPCNSDGVFQFDCGSNSCNSWPCGILNPPDAGHMYPYCDLGSCTCKQGNGTWQGNWQYWRLC